MTLKECKTREDVESVLKSKNISENNFEAKNALLLEAMGNPEMFYSNGNPTDEQKYEMILLSFLDGEWKYAEAVSKISMENV
ncbi:MAG: hypothetical protein HDR51_07130 [Treponema sp.]|nr:hypothetical protein [Treponema sp.]